MSHIRNRFPRARYFGAALCAISLVVMSGEAWSLLTAQSAIPDLAGVWDGTGRAHPINSETMPWAKTMAVGRTLPDGTKADQSYVSNFPVLNERALAFQQIFDEPLSPKYDCQPATPPAIEFDPYFMEIVQEKDRVLLRYEKDDQVRTVWLDGRQPKVSDYGIQGFSVGHYEANALLVETTHYVFDVTGFDDYNGIPSSPQKKVTERYWKDAANLKATVTVEDPMFLRQPASYTMRWLPAAKTYKLKAFDCDPEAARLSVQFIPSRYK